MVESIMYFLWEGTMHTELMAEGPCELKWYIDHTFECKLKQATEFELKRHWPDLILHMQVLTLRPQY